MNQNNEHNQTLKEEKGIRSFKQLTSIVFNHGLDH